MSVSGGQPAGWDDVSVFRRARALDSEALSLLYSRYLPRVYQYVLGRVGDRHLAEDLTAETFVAMVESIERLRADDELAFAGWLFSIARNKIAEHYRRQTSRPQVRGAIAPEEEPLALAEAGDPLGVVVARERWREAVDALQHLTEEQRTVLLYRCVLGYDTGEVARLLGRQAGAVRALQFRALSSLARLLARYATNPKLSAVRQASARPAPSPRPQRSDDVPRR